MDKRRCLVVTLVIFLCLGVLGSVIFYFIFKIWNDGDADAQRIKMMGQKSYKIAYSARARLYTGYNFTGHWEDLFFTEGDRIKCFNLHSEKFRGQIKSVETFGTCIRLYSAHCCKGHSVAYYPQKIASNNAYGPEVQVGGVYSISPCFQIELDKTQPHRDKTKAGPLQHRRVIGTLGPVFPSSASQLQVVVPDDLCIGMECGDVTGTHRLPITFYRVGYGGRVEFIWAEIHPGFTPKKVVPRGGGGDFFDSNMDTVGERVGGDQLGHFVGPRLLGSQAGDLPFENIFAQSSTNSRMLRDEEDKVLAMVQKGREAWICINVDYDGEEGTRPIGFVYRIQQPYEKTGDLLISQNYLSNLL